MFSYYDWRHNSVDEVLLEPLYNERNIKRMHKAYGYD